MSIIEISSQRDKYLISLDKSTFDRKTIYKLIENFRVEYLARRINFDDSIEEFGEKIKQKWWRENKEKYLKSTK